VEWGAIDQLTSGDQYRVGNVLELINRRSKDPWAGLARARQRLTRAMRESLV
jgi:bifunctional non-homologous end joining protein LigD